MNKDDYKLVLGLEIHLHVKTKTKMFCSCDANIYGHESNTHTCPVCLGLPGALPVPNKEAIEKTQLLGLALNCTLNTDTRFDRKHYFYPDLPKGYQISQYLKPLCYDGYLDLDSGNRVFIERIHLEEDTAKSFHEKGKTLIDFNKSGMPLIEIVTKPCIASPEDAVEFAKKIAHLVRYLGVGDANMEKGQLRIEPNISMRTVEMENQGKLPDYKVEIKNINSFRFMYKAVISEMGRQREALSKGDSLVQENRGYDEAKNITVPQRNKESSHEYRYFPEPDIPPMHFDASHIDALKNKLPELPHERVLRYKDMGLNLSSARTLVYNVPETCDLFDALVEKGLPAQKVANLLINKKEYRTLSIDEFESILNNPKNILDDSSLDRIIDEVISNNVSAVEDFKSGKQNVVEFLLGQVMRLSRGRAIADVVRNKILHKLS